MIYQKQFTLRQLIPDFSSRLYQSLYDCVRHLRLGSRRCNFEGLSQDGGWAKFLLKIAAPLPLKKGGWTLGGGGGIKICDRENEGKRGISAKIHESKFVTADRIDYTVTINAPLILIVREIFLCVSKKSRPPRKTPRNRRLCILPAYNKIPNY